MESVFVNLEAGNGGAVLVSIPGESGRVVVLYSTFENCNTSVESGQGGGGACQIQCPVAQFERCCGVSCAAFYGHFAHLLGPSGSDNWMVSASWRLCTLVECAPDQNSNHFDGGIYTASSVSIDFSLVNFTRCRSFYWAPALHFGDQNSGTYLIKYLTVFQCVGDASCYVFGKSTREISYANFVQNQVDGRTSFPVIYAQTHGSSLVNCAFLDNDAIDLRVSSLTEAFQLTGCSFSQPINTDYAIQLKDNVVNSNLPSFAIYGLDTAECRGIVAPTLAVTETPGGITSEATATHPATVTFTIAGTPSSSRTFQICESFQGQFATPISLNSGCCDVFDCVFENLQSSSFGGAIIIKTEDEVTIREMHSNGRWWKLLFD
jgi:hypothetical protein